MTFSLDHILIAVHDLDAATLDYQALGFTVIYGGRHTSGSTHNALIYFSDGSYVELIAPTGEPAAPNTIDYRALLNGPEGAIGYCLGSDNLSEAVMAMRERGVTIADPQPGGRARPDGQRLKWLTAMLPVRSADHPTDAITPFFIADETPRTLRVSDEAAHVTHKNGVTGILALDMVTHDPQAEIERLQKLLGIAPKRDNTDYTTIQLGDTRLNILLKAAHEDQSRNRVLSKLTFKGERAEPLRSLDTTKTHGATLWIMNVKVM